MIKYMYLYITRFRALTVKISRQFLEICPEKYVDLCRDSSSDSEDVLTSCLSSESDNPILHQSTLQLVLLSHWISISHPHPFQVQKSYCFSGHYCLEHSKQFSDKYHSVITSSCCLSIVYKLT